MIINPKMNEGSHTGNVALTQLAATLGISSVALKVALEEAFDIMQQNCNPGLSLQIALARLGYIVNSQALYGCLQTFRSVFSGAFNNTQGERRQHPFDVSTNSQATVQALRYPATQMRSSPYHTQAMAPPRTTFPAAQYTSNATTWRSGIHDQQGPEEVSRLQSASSRYTPEPAIPQPTPSNHYFGRNT
jgi:hypothetical protein